MVSSLNTCGVQEWFGASTKSQSQKLETHLWGPETQLLGLSLFPLKVYISRMLISNQEPGLGAGPKYSEVGMNF